MSTIRKPPLADKAVQRSLFKEKRRVLAMDHEAKTALDSDIQSRLILSSAYRSAGAVMLYAAGEHEIATSMIFYAAAANNKTVAYPRCETGGMMRFYRVESLGDLAPGRFGILEPVLGCEPFEPDERTLCVCPCLCCDMKGYRLGYGGGYYDRYLAGFPGTSAALCYSGALLPELAKEPHDIPVDIIFTEQYVKTLPKTGRYEPPKGE